jgi:DNA sulfur modification protein DndE
MASSTQKLFTSAEAEEALRLLQKATDLNGATLGRLALAVSLAEQPDLSVPDVSDETGVEFNRYSLLAERDLLFSCLMTQAHGVKPTEEVFFSRYVKAHVDHGLQLLKVRLDGAENGEALLMTLAASAAPEVGEAAPEGTLADGACVSVVGEELGTHTPIVCEFNNMKRSANSHLAIVGIPGTGKTQILLKILADIAGKAKASAPSMIFIDYKGDVSANESFVKVMGARVFNVPHDRLPINPFILPRYGEQDIKISAEEKAESFSSFQRLGPVQRGRLASAIKNAYQARKGSAAPYPDLDDLTRELQMICEGENAKPDTLTETVRVTFQRSPSSRSALG